MEAIEIIQRSTSGIVRKSDTCMVQTSCSSTSSPSFQEEEEELLREDPHRFCLFPIHYPDIWEAYKKHKSAFWTAEEIDFTADKMDWEKLTTDEKYFIENILAFFAGSDGIVLENLVKNFCQEITIPEARCFYSFQAMMENIHCCSGDTSVLTHDGFLKLQDVVNSEVPVWNGHEFSTVKIQYTGDQTLYHVSLNHGLYLDCTSDHTWYLYQEGKEIRVKTSQLIPGDVIFPYRFPVLPENISLPDNEYVRHWILSQRDDHLEGIVVLSVTEIPGGPQATYCFNEPLRHRGVFNGILTGQSETYSLMIDSFVKDPERKKELFQASTDLPCVQKKAEWALRWIHEETRSNFGKRLYAFGIVEGLFFSGSFCAIFWLKERGLMKHALGKSNEWIARDESLHTEFAVLLYKYIQHKVSQEEAHFMMYDAVMIEEDFICKSLPVSLIGMNSELMKQYIRFVADRLLVQFGYDKLFHETNPFPFMEKIGLDGKTNFFEQRVSEYSHAKTITNEDEVFHHIDDLDF